MNLRMIVFAFAAVLAFAGCNRGDSDAQVERDSKLYRSAMNDYAAGRMKQALATLRKVCRQEPANAMARFQLACLLHDYAKDHLGALLSYSEFLSQRPDSDKARIARDRLELCEREVAKELAEKYRLTDNSAYVREAESARASAATAKKTSDKLRDDLMQAMQRIAALGKENDRLKEALRDDASAAGAMVPAASSKEVYSAKSLLDGGDAATSDSVARDVAEAKKIASENDDTDRITSSADIAQLRLDEAAERALASSPLLPQQAPDARQRRDAAKEAAAKEQAAQARIAAASRNARPQTYVVVEGDTLYKIAVRFYGKTSAWRAIRNANRSKISVDGRVKIGSVLRLP